MPIRLATANDIEEMVPVVNAAFAIETFIEEPRIDEKGMAEMMRQGQFLVTENDAGRIVASIYVEKRGARGYFGMLAVDPAEQRKGLGRAMVAAAENHLRLQGCTYADILVLSLRPELLPVYRQLGYAETGTEEFHPSQPLRGGVACHCIVMSKKL